MLRNPVQSTVRLLLCETDEGVNVFTYETIDDTPAKADYWFETTGEAQDYCNIEFNVHDVDWSEVPDQIDGCQIDILAPVRVKGRDSKNPQFGHYEILINGEWVQHQFSTQTRND